MKRVPLAVVSLTSLLFCTLANASPFSAVVVYGDSLSDNGNLFAVAGQPGPPAYYPGRASNGPVAVELLSGYLGVPLLDFAWAGSTTGIGNHLDPGGTPTSLGTNGVPGMTTSFGMTSAAISSQAASALFVVWGGPDDFLSPSPLDKTPIEIANRAVTNIVGIASGLQSLGAQDILVPGLPDLGLTPFGQTVGVAQASALSAYFNTTLRNSLPAGVTFYDTSALMHRVVNNPAAYGFTNVTGQCIDPTASVPTPCANPDQYLFWDDFHPTTRAHQILAQEFADTAVPEPATFLLTGWGLVIYGVARCRNRCSCVDTHTARAQDLGKPSANNSRLVKGRVDVRGLICQGPRSSYSSTMRCATRLPSPVARILVTS